MPTDAEAAHLREQAARCRRLAASLLNAQDSATLLKTAEYFEAKAAKIDRREGPAMNGERRPRVRQAHD